MINEVFHCPDVKNGDIRTRKTENSSRYLVLI